LNIADLPTDRAFILWLAFHAKYEFSPRVRQIAEIGAIYMVQRLAAETIAFRVTDFGPTTPATLMELGGVRRIT
jgi:hypothetical protein